jgi:broad specificity phosphatase PhoE
MLAQPWMGQVGRVIASSETKALQAATVVARHRDLEIEVRGTSGEIDRSVTGFVPPEHHDRLTEQFFAQPGRSFEGWESATAAQARVVAALADVVWVGGGPSKDGLLRLAFEPDGPDVVVIGHGAVGTLLWCHLNGVPIARRYDQAGQGHYWSFDRAAGQMLHSWKPIDLIEHA